MRSNKLDNEFQLVAADSLAISPYSDIVHKDKAPWHGMIVCGVQPEEKRFDIRLWHKTFTLYEAFFAEQTIRQEVATLLGSQYYQVLVENETWSDDKVVQEANQLLLKITNFILGVVST